VTSGGVAFAGQESHRFRLFVVCIRLANGGLDRPPRNRFPIATMIDFVASFGIYSVARSTARRRLAVLN
jgi:hypothetical protein